MPLVLENNKLCWRSVSQLSLEEIAAFRRSKSHATLEALSDSIIDHLLQSFLMPENEAFNHWQTELRAWQLKLRRLNNSKSTAPNFTRADLEQALWLDTVGDDDEDFKIRNFLDKNAKYLNPWLISSLKTF